MKDTVGSKNKKDGAGGASLTDARTRSKSVPGGTSEVKKVFVVFVQLLYCIYYMFGHANFVQRGKNEFAGNGREGGFEVKKHSGGGDPATSSFLDQTIFHFKDIFKNVSSSDESTLFNKRPVVHKRIGNFGNTRSENVRVRVCARERTSFGKVSKAGILTILIIVTLG